MSNFTENNENRKEEILAKSRQSNKDEGVEYAVNKGAKSGNYFAIEIIGLPLLLLSLITGQMLTTYALSSVILASWFGEFFAKYRFLNQKRYLVTAICAAFLGVSAAVLFIWVNAGILQEW